MKCEQMGELLVSLVYGELPAAEHASLEEHLAECERCSRELALLRKAHSLLDEAANEGTSVEKLPLAEVTQRAMARIERGKRRWRTAAAAAVSLVMLLAVAQLMSLQVELDDRHIEIAWGAPEPVTTRPLPTTNPVGPETELRPLLEGHEARLNDLDQLVHLLIRLKQADNRSRDRDSLALERRLDAMQWRLSYLLRSLPPSNDFAQQFTTTREEGNFK